MQPHLDSAQLNQFVLRDLPEDELRHCSAHLETCAACRARFDELTADSAAFSEKVYAHTLPVVRARLEQASPHVIRPRWRTFAMPAVGLALAASLAFVVIRTPLQPTDADIRARGGATLQAFVKRADAVTRLDEFARVRQGDSIQFVVTVDDCRFAMLVATDDKGNVEVLFPLKGEASAVLPSGRTELPQAFRVDAAPGPERISAVFAKQFFRRSDVEKVIHASATSMFGDGCPIVTRTLEKAP